MPKVLGVGSTARIAANFAADRLDVVLTVEVNTVIVSSEILCRLVI